MHQFFSTVQAIRIALTVKKYKEEYNIDIEADSGETHHQLPVPAAYVVARDGTIKFAFIEADYKVRVPIEKLLEALKSSK